MKYKYDKELVHTTTSFISSPLDQVIEHVDMVDFL